MQYSQEHLKTMVYAEFGGQTECINGQLENREWPMCASQYHHKDSYGSPLNLSLREIEMSEIE